LPFASTPRPLDVRPVNHCVLTVNCVVDAFVEDAKLAKVLEAARESVVPVSQSVEEVALVVCDAYDWCENASYAVRPVASVPQDKTPAAEALTSQAAAFNAETVRLVVLAVPLTVIAVDDANGNCDAAAVEDAKNTPCVEIEVVVAEVVVAKVEETVNGYPKSAPVFVTVH
jgi:hypothetical protein